MNQGIMYSRGFFIGHPNAPYEPEWPTEWLTQRTSRFEVQYSPKIEVETLSRNGMELTLVGRVVDCKLATADAGTVLQELSTAYIQPEDSFFTRLDYLAGRFVLLVNTQNETFALTDASGNRALFYHDTGCLSSHPSLLSDVVGAKQDSQATQFLNSPTYQSDKDSYFPGIRTPFESVRALTPNTRLDLESLSVERFYPRDSLRENSTEDVIPELAKLFKTQVEVLADNEPLAVSLTAGIDSRVTLAATRAVADDILYYTLSFDEESQKEARVAKRLCSELGLEHQTIEVPDEVNQDWIDEFMSNTAEMSSPFRARLAKALYDEYPEDRVHLKSNVAEIGRTFYQKSWASLPPADAYTQSQLYGIKPDSPFVQQAFQEFIDRSDYDVTREDGYDPIDLFYWEHRIGVWQALGLFEWDVAQETHILYNCRQILELMLSVPFSDRKSNRLFHDLIDELWSEIKVVPIDAHKPEGTKKPRIKQLERYVRGALFRYRRMKKIYKND